MTIFFSSVIFLFTLLSSTQAQAILRKQAKGNASLGQTFVDIAKNYSAAAVTGGGTLTLSKSGSFSLETEVTAIRPLAAKFDLLCDQHGMVSSKSQSGNNTVTTSYSLGCRLTAEKFDVYEKAAIDLLETAQGNSSTYTYYADTSSSFDSYYPYQTNPQMYMAQAKALESLMAKATTIEEVMLVFSSWQGVISNYVSYPSPSPSSTSTISVSLSQKYVYQDYPFSGYPPSLSPYVNATDDN